MPWSRAFDEPIQPPKGKALVTLRDAASYIMATYRRKGALLLWVVRFGDFSRWRSCLAEVWKPLCVWAAMAASCSGFPLDPIGEIIGHVADPSEGRTLRD